MAFLDLNSQGSLTWVMDYYTHNTFLSLASGSPAYHCITLTQQKHQWQYPSSYTKDPWDFKLVIFIICKKDKLYNLIPVCVNWINQLI